MAAVALTEFLDMSEGEGMDDAYGSLFGRNTSNGFMQIQGNNLKETHHSIYGMPTSRVPNPVRAWLLRSDTLNIEAGQDICGSWRKAVRVNMVLVTCQNIQKNGMSIKSL